MTKTNKRRYDDGCGVAHALNLVGERWALLIVRDLILGPKRFSDLHAGLPGIGPNVLSQRLRDLEAVGVVERSTLPPPAGVQVYQLSEWGAELGPIVSMLGEWGARSPVLPRAGDYGADSIMLWLRNSLTPASFGAGNAAYQIRLGRDRFTLRVTGGRMVEVMRGDSREQADATLDTDPMTLGALLAKAKTVEEAIDGGTLTVTGDLDAARHLVDAASV